MDKNWQKDYPLAEEITEESLDDNHSLKKMLRLVGENKRVVDFGCATGYLAQLLNRRGCTVTGVEINADAAKIAEQYCEEVIVADLDFVSVTEILKNQEFDVAVFGDVLEHLRNPWEVLKETNQLLKQDGYIVASIPNIAHGAIRLALLQGQFEYTKLGILDNTHLRFFTRNTIEKLFDESGYCLETTDFTTLNIFSKNPLIPNIDRNEFNDDVIKEVELDENAEVLQFIVKAIPISIEERYAALNERFFSLQQESKRSQAQLHETQAELERSQAQLQGTQAELEQSQAQLQGTQAELERSQAQLHETQAQLAQSQAHFQSQLQQAQAELAQSHSQLHQTQVELAQSQAHFQSQLQQAQVEFAQSQTQLHETQAQLAQVQSQLHLTRKRSQSHFRELQGTQAQLAQLQSQLHSTQVELERSHLLHAQVHQDFQNTITAMESSKFWKVRSRWFQVRDALGLAKGVSLQPSYFSTKVKGVLTTFKVAEPIHILPESSQQEVDLVEVEVTPVATPPAVVPSEVNLDQNLEGVPRTEDVKYQKWLNQNYPREADLRKMADTVPILGYKPVFSIVMPVFNTPEAFLKEAIESVINQIYPYWELCIADDASTQPHIEPVLQSYAKADSRIKVVFREENGHISRASNSALEVASGEFVTLLDHDDLLTPDALYEVAVLLNKHPDADMIYSDEDKIRADHTLTEPYFKPDWCPDSFLSRMYTCHLGTYRRSLVTEIGGFRAGYEGSQDYDLVLRLTEKTDKIFHIPKILYHWRIHSDSTASASSAKPYAYHVAKKALAEALERRGEKGYITDIPGSSDHFRVRYEIENQKLVSILIPTRNLGETLNQCLASIFTQTSYKNYEVIVIDNGSTEQETFQVFAKWAAKEPTRFRCCPIDVPFNFSTINNYGVTQAKGDYLLFLNNDTEVVSPDWLTAMVEQAQRPDIGAVGALLLYPDDTIQHAGVVIGIGGVAGHSHIRFDYDAPGYFNQIQTVNNYSAVTAACLMCRREVFEAVGGFEEELSVAFNDIDLCLKIKAQGYRNIYLPHVVLYHYESKSRGYEDTPEKQARFSKEIKYMQKKWKEIIAHDPCYSPHLERNSQDYSIRA